MNREDPKYLDLEELDLGENGFLLAYDKVVIPSKKYEELLLARCELKRLKEDLEDQRREQCLGS